MTLKVLSVVGTRPNFIKEFVIDRACRGQPIQKILVHTGQHYDYKMSALFFKEFSLPEPDFVFNLMKGSHASETASMLVFLENVMQQEQPDVALVYGDVNSTLAAALAAAKLKLPIAHVEAGIRTPFRDNPEEINRRLVDQLAAVNFAHLPEAHECLRREGFPRASVELTGDVHADALRIILDEQAIPVADRGYCLVTLHRAENTNDTGRLRSIMAALARLERRVIMTLHPRTRDALTRAGFTLREPGIEYLEPQGYVDFIRLLAGATFLLSDSGGARREAYLLGKRVVSLVELVWVQAMVDLGWERVAGADTEAILRATRDFSVPVERPPLFGDGHAGERIIASLLNRFGGRT